MTNYPRQDEYRGNVWKLQEIPVWTCRYTGMNRYAGNRRGLLGVDYH